MRLLSSLTNRIFVAIVLLTVVSIAAATYIATSAVTAQAEQELRRGLDEAERLVEEYRRLLSDHFAREARLVADLPRLKATLSTNDAPTTKPIAEEFLKLLGAGLLVVANREHQVLARVGSGTQQGILYEVSVPIWIDPAAPEVLGTLTVGFWLNAETAARFRDLTASEIAFGSGGMIQTSTLPASQWPLVAPLLQRDGVTDSVVIGDHDYIAATRSLGTPERPGAEASDADGRVVILRSRTARLAFLAGVYRTAILIAFVAVLAATVASYATARSVTRPLGAVTDVMREMAATGDLTRRISLPTGTPWDDEDTRLLASTFNTMTDSIARFQREEAQRERLSSLGRLSTVVAHEIRNPLMIIKTTLHTLRGGAVAREQLVNAVKDIDEEVARLNRIVSEVLDFARPIKFDLAAADLNAICADAARAVSTGGPRDLIRLVLDPVVPPIVTDAERLRLALVNILSNARGAVSAASGEPPPPEAIVLHTSAAPDRVVIDVRDEGIGIPADDLPRIFDPFFTTRKTGTGLGLALTRNIIEGLRGSITISSEQGRGTRVRIELPAAAHI
jgi:signal transduction histidine kinase